MPEAARRRRRREVEFAAASGNAAPRRPLDAEEVLALQQGIDLGANAQFGLVKLSKVQLNTPCITQPLPSPQAPATPGSTQAEQPCSSDDPPQARPQGWPGVHSITLLEYAAWRGKDAIAWALVRAGANPAAREDCAADPEAAARCAEAAKACLSNIQAMHAVWMVRQVVAMRAAAADAAAAAPGLGAGAGSAGHIRTIAETFQLSPCVLCGAAAAALPVAFRPCSHACCEACAWDQLGSDARSSAGGGGSGDAGGGCQGLLCPCRQGGSGQSDGEGQQAAPDEEAHRRKEESRARWQQLPDESPRSRELRSTSLAKPKFEARSAAEVARLFLGATRAQRQGNLWKAAAAGNTERVKALVEAGVAVDAPNEYGQTALYLAAMHGHVEAVRLLSGWAAADTEVRAAGGSSALTAAAAHGHARVVRALLQAGAMHGRPGAEGRTAWRYAWEGAHEGVLQVLRDAGVTGDGAAAARGAGGCLAAAAGGECEGCERCDGCTACEPPASCATTAGASCTATQGAICTAAGVATCTDTSCAAAGGVSGQGCSAQAAETPAPGSGAPGASKGGACTCTQPHVECLIPDDAPHPGAGSYTIDGCLTPAEMRRLRALWGSMPPLPSEGDEAPFVAPVRRRKTEKEGAGAATAIGPVALDAEAGAMAGHAAAAQLSGNGKAAAGRVDQAAGAAGAEAGTRAAAGREEAKALEAGTRAVTAAAGREEAEAVEAGTRVVTAASGREEAEAGAGGRQSSVYGGVQRFHFYDAEGWVRRLLARAVRRGVAHGMAARVAGQTLPGMRFLRYERAGDAMAPHVDLSKPVPATAAALAGGRKASSHTFILYLESCGAGGETVLLQREGPSIEASGGVLAAVQPRVGRLLLFPHKCPHAGAPVVAEQLPKLLLRGELY